MGNLKTLLHIQLLFRAKHFGSFWSEIISNSLPCELRERKKIVVATSPLLFQPFTSCNIGCGGPQTISSAHDVTGSTRGHFSSHLPSFLKGHFRESHVNSPLSEPVTKFRTHVPAGHQDDFWGVPESIQGQLGSVCVLNEAINEQLGYVLYAAGRGPDIEFLAC